MLSDFLCDDTPFLLVCAEGLVEFVGYACEVSVLKIIGVLPIYTRRFKPLGTSPCVVPQLGFIERVNSAMIYTG